MSDLTGYILSLCNTLSAENKTPSVAMIRNRSERPLPLPDIIRVLKKWQENPQQPQPTDIHPPVSKDQNEEIEMRLDRLEKQMESVVATLEMVQTQVERLSSGNGRQ